MLLLEMGRMTDYDIRPKLKVWAGSVHSPVKDHVSMFHTSIQHQLKFDIRYNNISE